MKTNPYIGLRSRRTLKVVLPVYCLFSALVFAHLPVEARQSPRVVLAKILLAPVLAPKILWADAKLFSAGIWPYGSKANVIMIDDLIRAQSDQKTYYLGKSVSFLPWEFRDRQGSEGYTNLGIGLEFYTSTFRGAFADVRLGTVTLIGRYVCQSYQSDSKFGNILDVKSHCFYITKPELNKYEFHFLGNDGIQQMYSTS